MTTEQGKFTGQERERITEKMRVAAIAVAELWDACSEIEDAHGIEIGFDENWIDSLAWSCSSPASETEWNQGELWEMFLGLSTITRI